LKVDDGRRRRKTFNTLLVRLDGSPLAERALPYARALAQAGGVRIVLHRVVERVVRGCHPLTLLPHARHV
jgi:nucleotide-binding universal stress UspA family protein